MAFTADSRYVATLAPTWIESKADAKGEYHLSECGGEIRVWAVASGKQVFSLKVPGASAISEMAFQPMGKHLATAHRDGTVKVWDVSGVWRGEKSL
jgi:WD40 repeat protein